MGLSYCVPWQVREICHVDMASSSHGYMAESHSHHVDTAPTWNVLLGKSEKGREEKRERDRLKGKVKKDSEREGERDEKIERQAQRER